MKNNIFAILLSAGLGTRLKPLTDFLPKCLMPINGMPLLEIWIRTLNLVGIDDILVNLHYRSEDVLHFLSRNTFNNKIKTSYESSLLGTAGTVRANLDLIKNKILLLIHADNLCLCDFLEFIDYHLLHRPKDTLMTMMSFQTDSPESCGILELDSENRVIQFHEKKKNPPGNLANAAIYIIEPEIIKYIAMNNLTDFSNELIPKFLGKIATWENKSIMTDIGNPIQLKKSQDFNLPFTLINDEWSQEFRIHPIHKMI